MFIKSQTHTNGIKTHTYMHKSLISNIKKEKKLKYIRMFCTLTLRHHIPGRWRWPLQCYLAWLYLAPLDILWQCYPPCWSPPTEAWCLGGLQGISSASGGTRQSGLQWGLAYKICHAYNGKWTEWIAKMKSKKEENMGYGNDENGRNFTSGTKKE